MHTIISIAFLLFASLLVKADNDWSTPCSGSCAYESGDGTNTAWGSIIIDGSPEVISDISTAAGWSIMDCNSTSQNEQTIRLVCHDPDSGCEALFQGGAEDTIVRLPEECADAPFARVVNVTSSTNQTLTQDIQKRVAAAKRKRDSPPEVLSVIIDYNFNLLPTSRGTISLTALATTNPLQRPMATAQNLRRSLGYGDDGLLNARRGNSAGELVAREIRRRDLFADFIAGNQIPANATTTSTSSTNSTERPEVAQLWSKQWNNQFNVLNIQQSFPVIDVGLQCPQSGDIPAFNAKLKIDAAVNVQATVSVGFIVAGTILPPAITKAAFTSALDGNAAVTFDISAVAQGTFNTGLLPFYSSGMAGMSIPGILDVGPTFSINGQGIGDISVTTDAVVAANYKFPGLSMVYPQDEGQSNGQASQGDQSPLSLSIGGSASLTGSVSAHIIPRVDLGVSVLSGMASASVFLELDGYGSMDMSLSIEEATTTTVSPASTSTVSPVAAAVVTTTADTSASLTSSSDEQAEDVSTSTSTTDSSTGTSTTDFSTSTNTTDFSTSLPTADPIPSSTIDDSASETTSISVPEVNELAAPLLDYQDSSTSSEPAPTASTCPKSRARAGQRHRRRQDMIAHEKRASNNYNGCIGMQMGVKIVAGAQGKLFSFWKDSTSFDLFSQEWSLLNKCFKPNTKRALPWHHGPIIPSSHPPSSLPRRDLVDNLICPLIDQAITDALTADNQLV